MQEFSVPGMAVAVVKDGEVVHARGYGVRRAGASEAVDADTLFGIASNTKAFTCAAISMLAEDGKLDWDDPVTKHLPDFQMYDPWVTRELTLRDLVTHRAGLGLGQGDLMWWPATDFTRREIDELRRLGCEYVQIDAPQYAALLDEKMREGYRQRGSDPDKMLDANIELDNAIVAGHPGMTFGIHICRGNHKSMFYASGGYDRIAAQVFRRARFDRFLLEYDDERSGTFEPLRHVPDDRVVVLGLVSTKRSEVEPAAVLERRVAEASQFVPLERLAISPQCGFASTAEGNRLSADDQRRKLELVARTARAVWRREGS